VACPRARATRAWARAGVEAAAIPHSRRIHADLRLIGASSPAHAFCNGRIFAEAHVDLDQQNCVGLRSTLKVEGSYRARPFRSALFRSHRGRRTGDFGPNGGPAYSFQRRRETPVSSTMSKEKDHDQIDCCHTLLLISYGISASHDARADLASSAGRYDHGSRRRLRSGQNAS